MNKRTYKLITPAEVFAVSVESTLHQVTPLTMSREYTLRVEVRPTGCEFIDVFARLVAAHGKQQAEFYADRMGVETMKFLATLITLSGVEAREWGDVFAATVVEALLSQTDWRMNRVAEAARFSGPIVFSQWFRRRYKCTPQEWRRANEE